MEVKDFFKYLREYNKVVIIIFLLSLLLGTIITFAQPLKYSVKSRLLISQNISGLDPYTVSKSNQYLSSLFSQVLRSSSFFDNLKNSAYNIELSYFGDNYRTQIKTWRKTIEAQSIGDTGILEIYIYHPNTYQAQQIAVAVNQIMTNKSLIYQENLGDEIKISVIDQPLISTYPVKPNILFNFLASIILASGFSIFWIYIFPNKKNINYSYEKGTNEFYSPKEANMNISPQASREVKQEEFKREESFEQDFRGDMKNILF